VSELPTLEITARSPLTLGLRESWSYRELLWFLTWRDLKVRYKQTVLGVLWAILQPVGLMFVFTIFLGRLAHVPSNGVPYAIFVLAGLLPWQLFAHAMNESSNSLIANERLITKVYFPRVIIPAAPVLAALVDFAVGFGVLLLLLPLYGVRPGASIVFAPLFVLLAMLAAFGVSLWLSALNVQYRDVRYVLGFLTQLWMFVSPVVYAATLVPPRWRALYGLNPMAGVIEGFRWSIIGGPAPATPLIVASVVAVALIVAGGLAYFHRVEDAFADVI